MKRCVVRIDIEGIIQMQNLQTSDAQFNALFCQVIIRGIVFGGLMGLGDVGLIDVLGA